MTDRHIGYLVVLKEEIREDDSEHIINAIRMIKGIVSVEPITNNVPQQIAYRSAKNDLAGKLFKILE